MSSSFQDLMKKNEKELQGMLAEERGRQHDLRFQNSIGQLKTVHDIRGLRKHIARILTALSAANAAQRAQR